jgi:hypothetical protein
MQMQTFQVFGFTDEMDGPARESVLASFPTFTEAVTFASRNTMATCIIEADTDEVLWTYNQQELV